MPAVSTKKWFLKIYYKMLAVSTKKENTKIQFQNPKKNSLQISPIIYMRIMLVDFWTWKRVTERGVSLSLFARFKHSQRRARAFKIFLSLNLQIMIKIWKNSHILILTNPTNTICIGFISSPEKCASRGAQFRISRNWFLSLVFIIWG